MTIPLSLLTRSVYKSLFSGKKYHSKNIFSSDYFFVDNAVASDYIIAVVARKL
jgi:hypothetical protein